MSKYLVISLATGTETKMDDFKTLPLALVCSFEDPNEQCIERHAPLVKTKFAHPPAPWMKQLDIAELQKKTGQLSLPSTSFSN